MQLITIYLILILLSTNLFLPFQAQEKKKINQKPRDNINVKDSISDKVDWSGEDVIELIPVNVKNEFDEEIKVKLDTNREYPVGPHEWITLGKRKPGNYTLTIYSKNGEFVDNLTKKIDKVNKFVLNKNTVSNSEKITGLTTGQKVAITTGAIGAAAIGTALINKALEANTQEPTGGQYIPPVVQEPVQPPQEQASVNLPPIRPAVTEQNAFSPGGKIIKVLNTSYETLTLQVIGLDGNPVGNNWVIPKASSLQKPQPLTFTGEKITINPDQKIKALIPNGFELQRYAFELETDPIDGSYVWLIE